MPKGLALQIVITLAVVVGIIYLAVRSNTKRGAETVRAFVYMNALHFGASPKEANQIAGVDATNVPTEIIHAAMAKLRYEFGGKQLPMIAEAYRKGMVPKLSRTVVSAMMSKFNENGTDTPTDQA